MNDLPKLIAEETTNAYSFTRYGWDEWRSAATMLLNAGWNADEVEWILRSKITRWAADNAVDPERATGHDVLNYTNRHGATKIRGWIRDES